MKIESVSHAAPLDMTLFARFDTATLQVTPTRPLSWQGTPSPTVWDALAHWCARAEPGSLGWARLEGGAPGEAAAVAEVFSRHLDGDTRLRALPRAAGWAWRLHVKLCDALPWRARRNDDPWDCGYLRQPSAAAPWAQLRLRRPTLVVLEAGTSEPEPSSLARRPAHPRWPLCLLHLGAEGGELRFTPLSTRKTIV